jgi:HD-GYP domain-containing protein (c-di-GMP phosphodiesterase class II)
MLTEYPILLDQLVVGLFIRFDALEPGHPWRDKAFKIESDRQIEEIRAVGFSHVICVLNKSDRLPLPATPPPAPPSGPAHAPKTPVYRELAGIRGETLERNRELRERFERTGRKFHEAVADVANMLKRMAPNSAKTMEEAERVVGGLTKTFLSQGDVVVGLITAKTGVEERGSHALNVSVLAMILGRELKLSEPDLRAMGYAAVFHDVGKGRVPMSMMTGVSAISVGRAAKKLYREHPAMGARIVSSFPNFPPAAGQAILQHHEHLDGSGFPGGLRGEAVATLARMVTIADVFDNLCNTGEEEARPTPHEAVKQLYRRRAWLDENLLGRFIRNLGVYPPGSVVELSNGFLGMVVAVNLSDSSRPSVLIHHPDVPRKEALILDLAYEEETIAKVVRPEDLPPSVFSYLNPATRHNFYAEAASAG